MDRKEIRAIGTEKKPPLNAGMNPGDPTPEEIAAMCVEIRKEWGRTTERSRRAPERPVDMGNIHHLSGEVSNDE